ncbi:hypothetical protein C8A01DRAFT_15110 [Parachaetomium inaequale]|uniref:Uncharacterized protein n=1 Tax=Parachaetomium inaequale TaxID=2588326 RepID=A0AAN6SS64_9PEZI|nr:hypothetical protein C8A01DRAFT_15110 [Parachaetomium inaequale]
MSWSDTTYNYRNCYEGPSEYPEVAIDDARKCQVDGCRKKHAFSRPHGDRKVYSRFCSNHTCAKTNPDGVAEDYHCTTPRKSGERYCTVHLTCGEPGCAKRGEYVGVRDYVRWFCVKHRCTSPACRARATDPQQQRCPAHFTTCALPGCPRPAHLHRDGRLDAVCAAHYGTQRCLWPECARRASSRYCPSHHQCRAPGCTGPRTTAEDEFCRAHVCSTLGCKSEARFEGAHCTRHACVVVTCANPRLSAVPSSTLAVGGFDNRDRCAAHARARERRAASLGADDGAGLDWEGLRGRFEMGGERERERERWRLSDDLERLRRRERELEAERALRAERSRETERERLERMQRDFRTWRRMSSDWDRW